MQKAYITALYELACKDSRVVSVIADSGTEYDEFVFRELPQQCINFGIAEENMVAAAAGLANCGKIPFVYTAGAFLCYRAMEFLRDDICFQNQNVKIVGMGSGLAWSTLGPSHHTTEDISVLRAIPGLVILSPGSPIEVAEAVEAAYKIQGPVYIRIGMSGEKEIFNRKREFPFGKNIKVREGKDASIFVTGSIIEECLEAADLLEKQGIYVAVRNVSTIKPFDEKSVLEEAVETECIITVEEHNILGGLGSIIAEVIAENQLNTRFQRVGLSDCFARGYGTQKDVRKMNKLDAESLQKIIAELVGENKA